MKEACKCALRDFMMERLTQVRFEKKLTQAKFAELLMLDTRSYAAIEKGEYGCCALTLVMYLLYCCDDIDGFFDELRPRIMQVIEAEEKNVSYQKKPTKSIAITSNWAAEKSRKSWGELPESEQFLPKNFIILIIHYLCIISMELM